MNTNFKKELLKKLLAIALSLTVGATFIPLLGDSAFAEGETPDNGDVSVDVVPEGDVVDGVVEEEPSDVIIDDQLEDEPNDADAAVEGDDASMSDSVTAAEDTAAAEEGLLSTDLEDEGVLSAKAGSPLTSFRVYMKNPKKIMHIEAKFNTTVKYAAVLLNEDTDNPLGMYQNGQSLVDDINLSAYASCRTYTITLLYQLPNGDTYRGDRNLRVPMYDRPSSKGYVEAYHNYIVYQAPAVDYNLVNYRLKIQYSANGRNWKTLSNQLYVLNSVKIGGLKPNTNYRLRTFYTYNGYAGNETGNYLYLGTYRTGKGSKVSVKSIKVKAYKVKKKKQKVYTPYYGFYLGKRTYYKYKLKIEVKLKKKPGTNGIWINGKRYKGNKKKYTVKLGTFTSYSKPKGKKFKVAIYTYHNGSYGGYSPMYVKTKKIK